MNNNTVLILERSNANLTIDKNSGDYILEGIFAQFGVENNNKRIYEEKEYLPHLDYLKKKISENRLMGELDHPEKFEVSLDKVSHIIESLEYDSTSRQIKGKVRVLDTPAGKIARALIDSGVPISISSRAAGTVNESKKVSIKRIFTYDLVADPGFEDAQLARVNESFGLSNDDNIQIFDANKLEFKLAENTVMEFAAEEKTETKEQPTMNKKFITEDAMNKYSLVIKKEIDKINEKFETLMESATSNGDTDIQSLKEEIAQLKAYATELSNEINDNRGYSNHLMEKINQGFDYSEKEIATKVDQVIEYIKEEVTPNMVKTIKHNNHLVEKLNTTIGYLEDEIEPKLNESLEHNDYLAEEIEKNRAYAEFISENAVDSDDFKDLVGYAEHMFESYSKGNGKSGRSKDISENDDTDATKVEKPKAVKESSSKPEDIKKRATDIKNNIDAVLEQIKKEKIDSISEQKRYPFTTLISEAQQTQFAGLDETKKEKVREALLESKSFDKAILQKAFDNALLEKEVVDTTPKWLAEAPEKYKAIYESLDEAGKNKIAAQSNWYQGKLENQYQIKNFWETRGLNETVKPEVNDVLNESDRAKIHLLQNKTATSNPGHGYTADKVRAIAESMKRFK